MTFKEMSLCVSRVCVVLRGIQPTTIPSGLIVAIIAAANSFNCFQVAVSKAKKRQNEICAGQRVNSASIEHATLVHLNFVFWPAAFCVCIAWLGSQQHFVEKADENAPLNIPLTSSSLSPNEKSCFFHVQTYGATQAYCHNFFD